MQLPGTGSAFEGDRRGLAPDKFGASAAKAKISAKGQLIGSAVERAIATLHGLNAERIAGAKFADVRRSKEGTQVVGEAQIQPQTTTFGLQLRQGVKFKKASHDF